MVPYTPDPSDGQELLYTEGADSEEDFNANSTQIIDFHPVPNIAINYPSYEGECKLGSIYTMRNDTYTCEAENVKFDLCFGLEKENYLLCGVDPLDKKSGAIFISKTSLANLSLTTATTTPANEFLLIQLRNGSICYPMGGINITINNKTAIYQCNNLTLMFKEPTQNNNFWIAELYNVKENDDHSWSIVSQQKAEIIRVWR